MSNILKSLAVGVLLATSVWAQEPQEIPAAPIPAQVASAKKAFISNAGEETIFRLPKDVLYRGGPNRAYNQFYAAMKSWRRYELVSAPADADLVFEIGFANKFEGMVRVYQLKLVVLDPKTHVALWTITKYIEAAGMARNREKNYDVAMTALMEDVKSIVTASSN
ncbi:MAG TPA: hypothetical protein VE377_01710 [Candidatus Dormibacteraeota bacterium]|nr:hypothetical protein [Candidatus Dormibacteraeota bacterium]